MKIYANKVTPRCQSFQLAALSSSFTATDWLVCAQRYVAPRNRSIQLLLHAPTTHISIRISPKHTLWWVGFALSLPRNGSRIAFVSDQQVIPHISEIELQTDSSSPHNHFGMPCTYCIFRISALCPCPVSVKIIVVRSFYLQYVIEIVLVVLSVTTSYEDDNRGRCRPWGHWISDIIVSSRRHF